MLTTEQKRKILTRISTTQQDIETLKKCRLEIAAKGYSSATIASGGGSKTYSRLDLSKITEAIAALTSELKQLRAMLRGNLQGQGIWKNVLVVYDL